MAVKTTTNEEISAACRSQSRLAQILSQYVRKVNFHIAHANVTVRSSMVAACRATRVGVAQGSTTTEIQTMLSQRRVGSHESPLGGQGVRRL